MIDEVHRQFVRWAAWILEPVPGSDLGYGKNILARIWEGKGMIQPGGKGMVRVHVDVVAVQVDAYVKKLGREDQRILKVYYLSRYWTVEKRAYRLHMPVRTLYAHLDRIHRHYQAQQGSEQL